MPPSGSGPCYVMLFLVLFLIILPFPTFQSPVNIQHLSASSDDTIEQFFANDDNLQIRAKRDLGSFLVDDEVDEQNNEQFRSYSRTWMLLMIGGVVFMLGSIGGYAATYFGCKTPLRKKRRHHLHRRPGAVRRIPTVKASKTDLTQPGTMEPIPQPESATNAITAIGDVHQPPLPLLAQQQATETAIAAGIVFMAPTPMIPRMDTEIRTAKSERAAVRTARHRPTVEISLSARDGGDLKIRTGRAKSGESSSSSDSDTISSSSSSSSSSDSDTISGSSSSSSSSDSDTIPDGPSSSSSPPLSSRLPASRILPPPAASSHRAASTNSNQSARASNRQQQHQTRSNAPVTARVRVQMR